MTRRIEFEAVMIQALPPQPNRRLQRSYEDSVDRYAALLMEQASCATRRYLVLGARRALEGR